MEKPPHWFTLFHVFCSLEVIHTLISALLLYVFKCKFLFNYPIWRLLGVLISFRKLLVTVLSDVTFSSFSSPFFWQNSSKWMNFRHSYFILYIDYSFNCISVVFFFSQFSLFHSEFLLSYLPILNFFFSCIPSAIRVLCSFLVSVIMCFSYVISSWILFKSAK